MIDFKYEEDRLLFAALSIPLQCIFTKIAVYAILQGYTLKVTRTIDDRIAGVSKSDTHSEGRAIDVSVSNITKKQIVDLRDHFNNLYGEKYGTAPSGKKKQLVVYEESIKGVKIRHLHFQIRRGIVLSKFYKEFYNQQGD